jgi:hypothetical protein
MHRQPSPMPQSPVTAEIHEALYIHVYIASKISLNLARMVNDLTYFGHIYFSELV